MCNRRVKYFWTIKESEFDFPYHSCLGPKCLNLFLIPVAKEGSFRTTAIEGQGNRVTGGAVNKTVLAGGGAIKQRVSMSIGVLISSVCKKCEALMNL
uniref:Uncharacterized protein n=1 Tax=Strongyloides papillosus TaxID=174720 RepID=A0A0N5BI67_STREA